MKNKSSKTNYKAKLARFEKELKVKNRELKIEASLEKVRKSALAMKRPADMIKVCRIIASQLKVFGVKNIRNTQTVILNESKSTYLNYQYFSPYNKSIIEDSEFTKHSKANELAETVKKSANAFFSQSFRGKSLDIFRKYRRDDKQFPDPLLDKSSSVHFYFYSIGSGALGISTYNTPLNKEDLNLLRRFRNVFELAYRRFIDIEQAIAQAREAKIEAALERVRSRSLAMQKSDELQAVAHTVFEKLKELNVDFYTSIIILFEEGSKDVVWWLESKVYQNYQKILVPYEEISYLQDIHKSRESGIDFFSKTYSFKEKNKLFRHLFSRTDLKLVPKRQQEFLLETDFATMAVSLSKNTGIHITRYSQKSFSEQENEIFKKFAKVFDQAYTRFLDLQKSEAQTREAKIEAALEKVRASAMSMHKSEDLLNISGILFEELHKLGFDEMRNAMINIHDDEKGTFLNYDYSDEIGKSVTLLDYNTHPVMEKQIKQSRMANDAFSTAIYKGKDLEAWKEFRKKYGEKDDPRIKNITALYYYFYSIGNGTIGISTFSPIDEEKLTLLKRFRNVFNLAYQRYSDIALAEAQAKETQIELALERVRARTMAMQKSKELKEVIRVVYEQFVHLKINVDHAGFVVDYTPKGDWHFWIADEQEIPSKITHPYFDSVWAHQFNEAKEKGIDFFATNLNFEEKNKFYNELLSYVPGLPEASKDFYLSCPGLAATTVLFENVSLYIENFSGIPYSVEENNILMRFGKVFQQTYTRFLDLQKAEALAREAQIETSLERVRASSMAMHKSDELLDVISVVSNQLEKLGFRFDVVSFAANNQEFDYSFWLIVKGQKHPYKIYVPYINNPMFERVKKVQLEDQKFYTDVLTKEESKEWHKHLLEHNELDFVTERLKKYVFNSGYARSIALLPNIMLMVGNYSSRPYSEDENNIIKRFANAFDQAYRRFLDLQKAEAQTRESQIQLALERVRSRSMAMHHTSELQDVINTLHQQFKILSVAITGGAFIAINEENKNEVTCWGAGGTADYVERVHIPFFEQSIYTGLLNCINKGFGFYTEEFSYEEKIDFFNHLFKHPPYKDVPPERKNEIMSRQGGYARSCKVSKYTSVFIINHHGRKFSEEENNILIRFGNVFEQSYTRFLDLQKAEAQAREAQIEAALERVRAKAMAMHSSNDLSDTMGVLITELPNLGISSLRCGVVLLSKNSTQGVFYAAATTQESDSFTMIGAGDMMKHPVFTKQYESWLQKENYFVTLSGEQLESYYKEIFARLSKTYNPKEHKLQTEHGYYFSFSEGMFYAWSEEPYSEESINILNRVKAIIDLTFRRYLDLQKAEAQAREAQIEAALERVRSKAMAMNSSEDLAITVDTFFSELNKLNIIPHRCGVGIVDRETRVADIRATAYTKENVSKKIVGKLKLAGHPVLDKIFETWKLQQEYHPVLRGNEISEYYKVMNPQVAFPDFAEDEIQYGHYFHFKEGGVFAWTDKKLKEEDLQIFRKYTSVLSLTYRRYSELKEAEAQAREAKIEASLEKVRAKAMSMHTPEDLSETVSLFFTELKSLNVLPWRCGVGRIDEETRTTYLTTTSITKDEKITEVTGKLKQTGHPVLDGIFDHWKLQKEYFPVLRGDEINNYYSIIKPQIAYPDYPIDTVQYGHNIPFKEGFIFAWTENKLSEDELQIFRRFSSVISLTYRRYLDLKEAEARAIESVRQASLDRIRAETASMRTSEDLNRITPVIWRELKTLGVPFFRCGIYIIDEKTESVHVYLTTPDGKSLGVLNMSFNSNEITSNTVNYWRKKQVYKEHWNKQEFINWTKYLVDQNQIPTAESYQGSVDPPDSLDLNFVPFTQGMLYVGDVNPLTDEKLELVKTLAEAFSIAYARYEDFKNLEEAKNKIEVTLNELKSAQAQLIHSEKMASLGELTAGIAHEIKNPLNFVNNFSEVSRELLDEMKAEIQNNNLEEVIELVEDLKQNLDKINTHGKRADSIVKGMLLHSRGTSGEKTLTDINDLLDQYVTLAYHGLRAQDKEFNITIEKDYDETLEKINVVQQDLSRVFLNIINNACYAAYERKKKSSDNSFSPILKVSTKNLNEKVEIKIGDNGDGIPGEVLDKIFQPFFTTKPAGEGTGLGLSLSYDIVTKVHNGQLKVETEDQQGTNFIILLPINK